jgi:hypothetical protein
MLALRKGLLRAAAGCAACVLLVPGLASADASLDAGRALWRKAALQAYEYGYYKFCECHPAKPPETVVSVREGAVVRVRHRPADSTVEVPAEPKNLEFYWTVDGLFALLQSAFDRGVQVRATYDATLGFPREIYIDYDADFIGDELDVRLTAVTPIAP